MNVIKALFPALLLPSAYAAAAAGGGWNGSAAYVPAEDVMLEDVFFSRLLNDYMGDDTTMRATPVGITDEERGGLVSYGERWLKDAAESLTLWGASDGVTARENFYTAARLFLAEPKHEYADVMERALYNGVLAGLDSAEAADVRRGAAQTVLDAMGTTYAVSGADVYVNLFYRNTAHIKGDSLDLVLMQNTSWPWKADVFIAMKLNGGSGGRMRLHLRLPGWLRGEVMPGDKYKYNSKREFYQIFVNGRLSLERAVDGYIVIDREWAGDDVVRLVAETPVRRITEAAGDKPRFALQFGPFLYAYCGNDPVSFFRMTDPVGTLYDKDVLHTGMLIAKMYTSRSPSGESPWDCNLYPYYILPSLQGDRRGIWLDRAE